MPNVSQPASQRNPNSLLITEKANTKPNQTKKKEEELTREKNSSDFLLFHCHHTAPYTAIPQRAQDIHRSQPTGTLLWPIFFPRPRPHHHRRRLFIFATFLATFHLAPNWVAAVAAIAPAALPSPKKII